MKKYIFFLIAFVLMSSIFCNCITAPPPLPEPIGKENKRIFNKSFDDVWNLLMEYFSSRAYSMENLDKNSGFINIGYVKIEMGELSRYIWTGTPLPSMLYSEGRIKLNLFVNRISDNSTSVAVNVFPEVYNNVYKKYDTVDHGNVFKSTGMLELEILDYVRK